VYVKFFRYKVFGVTFASGIHFISSFTVGDAVYIYDGVKTCIEECDDDLLHGLTQTHAVLAAVID
jgi:hypothetical protein